MFFYGILLVICHTVVYFTYEWLAKKPIVTAGDGIMALAIGFGLGFVVAIAAFAPSGKPKKETFDDIFKK